ncbi:hypothetical protein LCGC14_1029700 [marine sediment metagenome]|uniref:Uncharacterized protein n=1 Tax=marine sediment metagenome TaxID=412755 RepID=A0A0F9R0U8_9ZZZZ
MYEDILNKFTKPCKYTHYELTNEDIEYITKYFNERNLEGLIGYCSALAMVASATGWRGAETYLKDVGEERFFHGCNSCDRTFDCDPEFALNECGERYEKWTPFTEGQKERLEELKKKNVAEIKEHDRN